MSDVHPGRCRHCGCTEASPCWSCRANGDVVWTNEGRDVCGQPTCRKAEAIRLRRLCDVKAGSNRRYGDRYVGMGFGAVIADMRKRERARKRKRRKAGAE